MLLARKPVIASDAGAIPRHWMGGSALASNMVNGVSLLFPAGERFFVRSVNRYIDEISPELRAEVRGFFGQEGSHAKAHEHDFERLRGQGYDIDGFLRVYTRHIEMLDKRVAPELNLAATAAAEHFTAIMAEDALSNGELSYAHPEMRKLLLWHAAEEIEHKHVAFDVLRQVNPSYALRMAGLAMASVNLAGWWAAAMFMLCRQDGITPRKARAELRAIKATVPAEKMRPARQVFARGIREYMRRDFHPRQNDNYALAAAYLREAGFEARTEAA